jgi:hypothetical protein
LKESVVCCEGGAGEEEEEDVGDFDRDPGKVGGVVVLC